MVCQINIEAQKTNPCLATVPGIAYCPVCGAAMCPVCHRHNVTQLSRVTGYISSVDGWNEAKKQELKDRQRHNL
jgi:anaerobic ribonucleoside-triphosphate reductase